MRPTYLTLLPAGILLATSQLAVAATYDFDASFKTQTRQSTWAPGDALRVADSVFVGPSLDFNKKISGNGSKGIPNPAYAIAVALGCGPGTFQIRCPSATITRRGNGSAELTSRGRIGLEFGYSVDAGSVGAEVDYGIGADIPDQVKAGEAVNLRTTADLLSGVLDAFTPNVRADIDQITELTVDMNIKTDVQRATVVGTRDKENITKRLVDVAERISLVDADLGSIEWMRGLTERIKTASGDPVVALTTPILDARYTWAGDLPTKSLAYKKANEAYKTLYDPSGNLPNLTTELARLQFTFPSAEGETRDASDGSFVLRQRSDLLDGVIDMDGIVGHATTTPFGVSLELGKNASVWGDLLDAEAGISIDVVQELKFAPRLEAELAFSAMVEIDGLLTDTWSGNWLTMPDIRFFEDTEVTPIFDLFNTFQSTTELVFGVNASFELGKLGASLNIYNKDILKGSFGPLYKTSASADLTSLEIYFNAFELGGFSAMAGESFFVDVEEDVAVSAVPLPGGLPFLLSGFGLFALLKRKRSLDAA